MLLGIDLPIVKEKQTPPGSVLTDNTKAGTWLLDVGWVGHISV
jgi:hypothetical protein